MNIAVTGAAGFVGRHVLAELEKYSVDVVAITRKPLDLPVHPRRNVVQLDLQDISYDTFGLLGNPDVLIHLAWGGLPNYGSLHHFEKELPEHYRFLNCLIKSGLRCLVVAGTCFEYGMQSGALKEGIDTHPSTPYGYAKDALRRQLEFLQCKDQFSLIWGRLFYLYGDGQADTSLFSQLRKAVESGKGGFNMSGGEQLRDYLPVADAAKILVSLALQKRNIGVVNVCSGKPVSVRKLVEGFVETNKWKIDLNLGHYPYPDYEPMVFWGDRSKLENNVTP